MHAVSIGETALFPVSEHNHMNIARVLIEGGADVNPRCIYERSALFSARSAEIAGMLVDGGADVNAVDFQNYSVLQVAVASRHWSVARVLIDKHAADIYSLQQWVLDYEGDEDDYKENCQVERLLQDRRLKSENQDANFL